MPRFATTDFIETFEVTPYDLEKRSLIDMVDAFVNEMKKKLLDKLDEGFTGWDKQEKENQTNLNAYLDEHLERGDFVDVANFAAFLWNLQQR